MHQTFLCFCIVNRNYIKYLSYVNAWPLHGTLPHKTRFLPKPPISFILLIFKILIFVLILISREILCLLILVLRLNRFFFMTTIKQIIWSAEKWKENLNYLYQGVQQTTVYSWFSKSKVKYFKISITRNANSSNMSLGKAFCAPISWTLSKKYQTI